MRRTVSLSLVAALAVACSAQPAPPPRPAPVPQPPPVSADAAPVTPDASAPAEDVAAPVTPDASVPVVADASAPASAEHVRSFRGRTEDEWIDAMANRPVVRVISRHVSTAIVYRVELEGGVEIGFKPERPGQEQWWRSEIASYRLARLLGIENRVPPVVGRRIALSQFGRFAARSNLISGRDGMVNGSASVWMPDLHGEDLHRNPAHHEWVGWINPENTIPEANRERARQITELLVFDFLMGNYDRWNCCNIPIDEQGQLVFRDNDAGWQPRILLNVGGPSAIRRLPRSLYEGVQRATAEALRAEIERDPRASDRLLPNDTYPAYTHRRQVLLDHLQRVIRRYGEERVFAWP